MNHENDLKSLFYRAYDASQLAIFLSRISALNEFERRTIPGFLGEGVHFQSFELNTLPISLAVNVAKASFLQRGEAAVSRWQKAIAVARTLEDAVLVPPMDVISACGLTAIVMPTGKNISKTETKKVDSMLRDTAKALGQAGLVLDDYPQVREAMGLPFIVDWSDLSFIRNAYSFEMAEFGRNRAPASGAKFDF